MLLSIDTQTKYADRIRGERLKTFGFNERTLQDILFRSLDRLFPDDELILLMQSREFREEPDMMAVDKEGSLYIFELKAWESHHENILQVLRYGQIYGASSYDDLNRLFDRFEETGQSLKEAHKAKFEVELNESSFNRKQVFIVMTNGLDYKTREAIQYWRSCGLDVRPWVYRVYKGDPGKMLLEMSPFRVADNPYEDIAEGYYILNTNFSNDERDHEDMLANKKAAAYFDPPKRRIEHLNRGDIVFLYQSGVGIVAVGEASGKLQKCAYQGNPEHMDEEYFMKLRNFKKIKPPISAGEVKKLTGVNYVFMSTMFGIDAESGKILKEDAFSRSAASKNTTAK